jgi:hypothetical protein
VVSFIHVESFGNIDISQGKPPSWTETLQQLRFASQKLKELAGNRSDSRRPSPPVLAEPDPPHPMPFATLAVEGGSKLQRVFERLSEVPTHPIVASHPPDSIACGSGGINHRESLQQSGNCLGSCQEGT